jgi:hypothetical protein
VQTVSSSVSLAAATLYWATIYNPTGTDQNLSYLKAIKYATVRGHIMLGYETPYSSTTSYIWYRSYSSAAAMPDPAPALNTSNTYYQRASLPIILLYE